MRPVRLVSDPLLNVGGSSSPSGANRCSLSQSSFHAKLENELHQIESRRHRASTMSLLGIPSTFPSTMAQSEDQMDLSTEVLNRSSAMQDIDIDLELGDDLEPTKEDENMMEDGTHDEELPIDNDDEMIDDTEQVDAIDAEIRDVPVEQEDSVPVSHQEQDGDEDLIDPFADDGGLELETLPQADTVQSYPQDPSSSMTAALAYDSSASNRIPEMEDLLRGSGDNVVERGTSPTPQESDLIGDGADRERSEAQRGLLDQRKLSAEAKSALPAESAEALASTDPNGVDGKSLSQQHPDNSSLLDNLNEDPDEILQLDPDQNKEAQVYAIGTSAPNSVRPDEAIRSAPDQSGISERAGDAKAAETLSKDGGDKSYSHPIVVHYQGSEVLLFAPDDDNDQSEAYLLGDASLANDNLGVLFESCRSVLEEDINEREHLVIKFPSLDLEVGEVYSSLPLLTTEAHALQGMDDATSISLSQILDVYLHLHRNASTDTARPLQMVLSTRIRLGDRLRTLQEAAENGSGLGDLVPGSINLESLNDAKLDLAKDGPDGASGSVTDASSARGNNADDSERRVDVSKDVRVTPSREAHVDVTDFALEFESPLKSSAYGIANAPASGEREEGYQAGLSQRAAETSNGESDDFLEGGVESLKDRTAFEKPEGFLDADDDAQSKQALENLRREANPLASPKAGNAQDLTTEASFDGDFDAFEDELASLEADKPTDEGKDPSVPTNNSSTNGPKDSDSGGDGHKAQSPAPQALDQAAEDSYHSAFEDDLVFEAEDAKGLQAIEHSEKPDEEAHTFGTTPSLEQPENDEEDLLETSSLLDESAYVDDGNDVVLETAAAAAVDANGTTEPDRSQKGETRKRSRSPDDDLEDPSEAQTRTFAASLPHVFWKYI